MTPQNQLDNLSIEELQKVKLKEEILALTRPVWRQTQFISIVVTLIIAFIGTSITIWQKQAEKVEYAEAEKSKYKSMTEELLTEKHNLKLKTEEANLRLLEALSEKTTAVSEKSEIKNQINSLQEIQLIKRERSLSGRISRLQNIEKELAKRNNGYKRGFIEAFVSKNQTVQNDIYKYTKEGMKLETENWLKKQILYTALNQYENYIVENTNNYFP
jgi:hypothetical protein